MSAKQSEKTVNMRVFEKTRNRLKVKAAKAKKSMLVYTDELSKEINPS